MKQVFEKSEIPHNGWLLNYVYKITKKGSSLPDLNLIQIIDDVLYFKWSISIGVASSHSISSPVCDAKYDCAEYVAEYFDTEGDLHFVLDDDEILLNIIPSII